MEHGLHWCPSVPHAEPLTFLTLRFGLAAALLVLVSLASRAPWPKRLTEIGHFAVAGLLVYGVYLGGVFLGISMGVEAGVSALIVGLQPLLTAALAAMLLGERVIPRQWLGLALGLFGVTLVLAGKIGQAPGSLPGGIACAATLVGITVGTLYQKRFCANMDLRTGSVVQFVAAGAATAPLAFWFEHMQIQWHPDFVFALLWLLLVLSLGAVSLLYLLIRRGGASEVASLFFLVPPCTALIAWPLFHETLGPVALAGMAITAIGVALASQARSGTAKSRGD